MSEALHFHFVLGVSRSRNELPFPSCMGECFFIQICLHKIQGHVGREGSQGEISVGFPPVIWRVRAVLSHTSASPVCSRGSPLARVCYVPLARNRCSVNTPVFLYSELLGLSEGGIPIP